MKYGKLVEKFLSQKSGQHNTQIAVALVAGLAAGAVISILLAPSKGSTFRKGISSRVKDLFSRDYEEQDEAVAPEVPHFTHIPVKKRKSDIKDLISEAHHQSVHTEQSLN
ncbi:MAG: YtxH domain-containing protein [Bacteroidia bacterium]